MKAAALLMPGMVTTDVGGINEKSLISCFFRAKIEGDSSCRKDNILLNGVQLIGFNLLER